MNLPNKLTVIRIILAPVFLLLMMVEFPFHYLAAGLVFGAASLTDLFDGRIARRDGLITDLGKFLDPLADKLLVLSAMCIFCQWGMFPAWALMIVLAREFAVTACGSSRWTMAALSRRPGPARSRRPARWSASALS